MDAIFHCLDPENNQTLDAAAIRTYAEARAWESVLLLVKFVERVEHAVLVHVVPCCFVLLCCALFACAVLFGCAVRLFIHT